MFTVTMAPEKGKCKFKHELLTMTAFKEWVCQDPKADICSAQCQICANSINIGNCHVKSAMHKNYTETVWCHRDYRCGGHLVVVLDDVAILESIFVENNFIDKNLYLMS